MKVGRVWRIYPLLAGVAVTAAVVPPSIGFLWLGVCVAFVGAFVVVRQGNAMLGMLRIGPCRFHRNFTIASWFWLQLSNWLAVFFSLGLLIPWARIRTLCYRLHRTSLVAPANALPFGSYARNWCMG